MAIVVVGGSGKDVGKTALVCAVISALREFGWTAVKITGHDYGPTDVSGIASGVAESGAGNSKPAIFEESKPGSETDTERYLAAGARRALLVTRVGRDMPIDEIRRALDADQNVIFESNRIVDAVKPDVCLALVGSAAAERKASFLRLLHVADAVVCVGADAGEIAETPKGIPRFRLESTEKLTPIIETWIRARLITPEQ